MICDENWNNDFRTTVPLYLLALCGCWDGHLTFCCREQKTMRLSDERTMNKECGGLHWCHQGFWYSQPWTTLWTAWALWCTAKNVASHRTHLATRVQQYECWNENWKRNQNDPAYDWRTTGWQHGSTHFAILNAGLLGKPQEVELQMGNHDSRIPVHAIQERRKRMPAQKIYMSKWHRPWTLLPTVHQWWHLHLWNESWPRKGCQNDLRALQTIWTEDAHWKRRCWEIKDRRKILPKSLQEEQYASTSNLLSEKLHIVNGYIPFANCFKYLESWITSTLYEMTMKSISGSTKLQLRVLSRNSSTFPPSQLRWNTEYPQQSP